MSHRRPRSRRPHRPDATLQTDQYARERFAQDLLDAHGRAVRSSDQRATQEILIELGLREETVASGELSMVGAMLGAILGSLVDDGCSLADMQSVALGNREIVHQLQISKGRREQLIMFLDFGIEQLARLCEPGKTQAVISAIVAMFSKTVNAIGLAKREQPA